METAKVLSPVAVQCTVAEVAASQAMVMALPHRGVVALAGGEILEISEIKRSQQFVEVGHCKKYHAQI